MGYVPLEKLLDKSEHSIYKLVILASMRALELAEGKAPFITADKSAKISTLALNEIADGKIYWKRTKEQTG